MRRAVVLFILIALCPSSALQAAGYKLIAWNDLGMHCTDGVDYSVFGVLPPYNTVNAQLIDPFGKLVRNPGGITVTYEAIADTRGSINSTSIGKTNFWQHVQALFGTSLEPNVGLAGSVMPGTANQPQAMRFEADRSWFTAVGIPITPYDDRGARNYYPMMRIKARDGSGALLAATDVVLPVSDEMFCIACHASGGSSAAKPASGWAFDPDPSRDVKLNTLALHDDRQAANGNYQTALSAQGYLSTGLHATALSGTPVLCARCHPSNALPGLGMQNIQPLTEAIHKRHILVIDPATGVSLGTSTSRQSCYRCHPGPETRCLRGAMGSAAVGDASYEMECQDCHGSMADVGANGRAGWLQEPNCHNCHTGTATENAGQIRFTNAFSSPGVLRAAPNSTFATTPNVPAAGFSLYRFSTGHGSLQCELCHGSTHAEYITAEANDNVQSGEVQGHAGVISDCETCHGTSPSTTTGGPHGLHPVGAAWVSRHPDIAEHGSSGCRACHGADYRGTVLSRTLGDRRMPTTAGTKDFWRGFQIGCYTCHSGPSSESSSRNRAAVVSSASASTVTATPVSIALTAADADGNALTLRVVSRPGHGRAGIAGNTATYIPDSNFSGTDTFTFAAWDGSTDSNLGTVTIKVENSMPLRRTLHR